MISRLEWEKNSAEAVFSASHLSSREPFHGRRPLTESESIPHYHFGILPFRISVITITIARKNGSDTIGISAKQYLGVAIRTRFR